MAVTTAAVIGAAAAVKSTVDAKKAAGKAAKRAEQANIQSAKQLEKAGRQAEADILLSATRAAGTVGVGAEEAEARITPFVAPGIEAFNMARDQILQGLPLSGPVAESIRQASTEFVTSRPNVFKISGGPVQAEVGRQADIAVSGAAPAFTGNLLTAGQQGIAAVGDVGGIRQRGLERLADIAGATGAQRASVLVGSTPELATLSAGAEEARLLGDVSGQQARTDITETLAQLAGRVI